MSPDSERAEVWRAIHTLDDRHTDLQARMETIPGQLEAIRDELGVGGRRFEAIEGTLGKQGAAIAENTALTKAVADSLAQHTELLADIARAQVFARTVGKVVAWVGRSAKRVVIALGALAGAAWALWQAFYALTHGGKGP